MSFPLSRAVEPGLVVLDEVGSTNTELASRPGVPAIATLAQTAGKGRLGRTWSAPPGTSLAVSVRLPFAPLVALAAGLAMTRAVRSLVPHPDGVWLKWPNDVLIDGRKVSGLLGEVTADDVVMGAGLNLTMTEEQLPVPTATSLVLAGARADDLADRALAAYLTQLGLARHATLAEIAAACSTLGRDVQVELPDGSRVHGRAERLDADGRLVVAGLDAPLSAGDVIHVR